MEVLVCRPEKDAYLLASRLSSLEIPAVSLPTIKISYKKLSQNIQNYTSLIFTSKYAVEGLLSQYAFDLLKNKRIYSVGASTAKLLKKYGFDNVVYPSVHGAQELVNLIYQSDISKESFAVLSGVAGNELLIEQISQFTICDKFEVYERVFEDTGVLLSTYQQFFFDKSPKIIVTTSIDVFKSLNRIFTKKNIPKDAIVTITSPKMLEFVNEQGFKNTLKLERFDNNYICEKILEFVEAKDVRRKKYSTAKK